MLNYLRAEVESFKAAAGEVGTDCGCLGDTQCHKKWALLQKSVKNGSCLGYFPFLPFPHSCCWCCGASLPLGCSCEVAKSMISEDTS